MNFPRSRLPLWLSFLLVGAMLWAPLWGQWHGIAHGPRHALSDSGGLHVAHAHEDHGHEAHAEGGHFDPLGHEAKADLCQVLDHLAQAERLTPSCVVGSPPRVAVQPPIFRLVFSSDRVRWSCAQARAPPALI